MDQELRFLTKRQVKEMTTLSSAEIDRREARGAFPRRHRLSGHPKGRVVWWFHHIVEWMRTFPPLTVQPVVDDDSG
jgi:predicted DNA-binding transcriptional regulator AlpA